MTLLPEGPNADQIEYWNHTSGPRWVRLQERLDAQIRPIGERVMDAAGITAGESVLDIGCGCGCTCLTLGERVTPTGRVVGADISRVMLDHAETRAAAAGASHVTFANLDAQTHEFAPDFDLVFSRFGVMFFENPTAAFANLRTALRPGGRLAFVCWQGWDDNQWMTVPVAAMADVVELPPLPPNPDVPGPFSMADRGRLRGMLADAGYTDISITSEHPDIAIGGGLPLDDAVELSMHLGPHARILESDETDDATRTRARQALRDALGRHVTDAGPVVLPGAVYIVTARNP